MAKRKKNGFDTTMLAKYADQLEAEIEKLLKKN